MLQPTVFLHQHLVLLFYHLQLLLVVLDYLLATAEHRPQLTVPPEVYVRRQRTLICPTGCL